MRAAARPETMHAARIEQVLALITDLRPRRVLDLGCGSGALLSPLARMPDIEEAVGIDVSDEALAACRAELARLDAAAAAKARVLRMSFADPDAALAGFDLAVMLETIEHVESDRLSQVERGVFLLLRPRHVLITTPNAEMNALLGVPAHRFREADHRFEWTRAKFERWAHGVAARCDYQVRLLPIGVEHPTQGAPTQAALFSQSAGETIHE